MRVLKRGALVAALTITAALGWAAISLGHNATFGVHGTIQIDDVRGQLISFSGAISSDKAKCVAGRSGDLLFRGRTGVVSHVGILHTTDNGKWKIANVHGGVGTFAADFPKRTIKHNAHHTHKCAHSQAQVEFP